MSHPTHIAIVSVIFIISVEAICWVAQSVVRDIFQSVWNLYAPRNLVQMKEELEYGHVTPIIFCWRALTRAKQLSISMEHSLVQSLLHPEPHNILILND